MAISKNSRRVQFTLNESKEKEKQIIQFLDECLNPNSTIKEIIYNYIVSNCESGLPKVIKSEVTHCNDKSAKVAQSHDTFNEIVTHCEEKSHETSELESNELEELNKFL
ncbi:hypothetical protein [Clostridium sp. Marseille-Q2269]|uniref:hypothetical protein n=1 Tax=Clostridium sp. Marseille-Q2269 TaxID=2942205 RepID=UPI0020741716|nr:hypothetical protein [Clostridium sp. Marseille-Q2269]